MERRNRETGDYYGPVVENLRNTLALLSLSPNGQYLLYDEASTLAIYDIDQQQVVQRLNSSTMRSGQIAFTSDSSQFILGTDSEIHIVDLLPNGPVSASFEYESEIEAVDYTPNNTQFVTVRENGVVDVYSRTSQLESSFTVDGAGRVTSAVVVNNRMVAVAQITGRVSLWDINNGRLISQYGFASGFNTMKMLTPDVLGAIGVDDRFVAFSWRDGNQLFGFEDGTGTEVAYFVPLRGDGSFAVMTAERVSIHDSALNALITYEYPALNGIAERFQFQAFPGENEDVFAVIQTRDENRIDYLTGFEMYSGEISYILTDFWIGNTVQENMILARVDGNTRDISEYRIIDGSSGEILYTLRVRDDIRGAEPFLEINNREFPGMNFDLRSLIHATNEQLLRSGQSFQDDGYSPNSFEFISNANPIAWVTQIILESPVREQEILRGPARFEIGETYSIFELEWQSGRWRVPDHTLSAGFSYEMGDIEVLAIDPTLAILLVYLRSIRDPNSPPDDSGFTSGYAVLDLNTRTYTPFAIRSDVFSWSLGDIQAGTAVLVGSSRSRRDRVLIHKIGTAEPISLPFDNEVRDLIISQDGDTVYALTSTRNLHIIDAVTGTRNVMQVPFDDENLFIALNGRVILADEEQLAVQYVPSFGQYTPCERLSRGFSEDELRAFGLDDIPLCETFGLVLPEMPDTPTGTLTPLSPDNRPESDPVDTIRQARVTSPNPVNIRNGPGTNFGIVATLNPGDVVTVIDENEDGSWLNVQLPGNESGWIADFLVELVE
jgi:hypothetical protein